MFIYQEKKYRLFLDTIDIFVFASNFNPFHSFPHYFLFFQFECLFSPPFLLHSFMQKFSFFLPKKKIFYGWLPTLYHEQQYLKIPNQMECLVFFRFTHLYVKQTNTKIKKNHSNILLILQTNCKKIQSQFIMMMMMTMIRRMVLIVYLVRSYTVKLDFFFPSFLHTDNTAVQQDLIIDNAARWTWWCCWTEKKKLA